MVSPPGGAARDTLTGLAERLRKAIAAYDAGQYHTRPLTSHERAVLPVQMARVPLYDLAEAGRYVAPHIGGPVQAVLRLSATIGRARWLIDHRDHLSRLVGDGGPPGGTRP